MEAAMMHNPFTPTFGNEPPVLAGRNTLIGSVLNGLENTPGDPNRVTVFTGPRGSGKTVLLSRIAAEAEGMGWISVNTIAGGGMLEEMADQLLVKAVEFLPKKATSRVTSVKVSGVGGTREILPEKELGWRTRMEGYLGTLAEKDVGLLFTIDEVMADVEDFVSFISTFQFFIRDKRNVALLMAGQPNDVLQMSQDKRISFLRRAFLRRLEPISMPEVKAAMKKTIAIKKRRIEAPALEEAAKATMGLPFMIQLVGYHSFNQSNAKTITLEDVTAGIHDAKSDMEFMVLDSTWRELTKTEKRFLLAMLEDEEESEVSVIAERMGSSLSGASHYKRRLIEKGVLDDTGRGSTAFRMPMLKTLLLERRA